MIKSIKIIYFLTLPLSLALGQNIDQSINLIIMVDDKIQPGAISGAEMKIIDTTGRERFIEVEYHPGDLLLKNIKLDELLSNEITSIIFQFGYYEYKGEKQKIYHYTIKMEKGWLRDYYLILRVYNLDKKVFRKRFNSFRDKDYVYEIDSPCCTFRLPSR